MRRWEDNVVRLEGVKLERVKLWRGLAYDRLTYVLVAMYRVSVRELVELARTVWGKLSENFKSADKNELHPTNKVIIRKCQK